MKMVVIELAITVFNSQQQVHFHIMTVCESFTHILCFGH